MGVAPMHSGFADRRVTVSPLRQYLFITRIALGKQLGLFQKLSHPL